MPFKSDKQRKYLFAKKPEVAKKLAKKYRYGGHVGAGESVAGTSSDGTENRHVFEEGGVAKKKKGFFDFLKNPNIKKLEKMGYDRYGRDPKKMKEKKDREAFKKIKEMFKKNDK